MVQSLTSIVTGYMEFLVTKHHVQDTGLAGMELLRSSCALEDCCIMNRLTVVTGLRLVLNKQYLFIFQTHTKNLIQNVEGCQKHREYT